MELRVASNPASYQRPRRFSNFESPRSPISPVAPFDASLELPPVSAPSGLAGDRSPSRPEVRILQHPLARPLRVCPAASTTLGRLPMHSPVARFLHLPAVPATDLRVTPNLSSFDASVACARGYPRTPSVPAAPPDEAAGRPAHLTFRLGLGFESPGRPGSSLPWLRLMVHQVSLAPAPSGFTVLASSSCPDSCNLRLGQMMTPALLELCILSLAADESSFQPGFALPIQLWMHSFNLTHAFHLSANRPANCRLQLHPASFFQTGTAFPIPYWLIN